MYENPYVFLEEEYKRLAIENAQLESQIDEMQAYITKNDIQPYIQKLEREYQVVAKYDLQELNRGLRHALGLLKYWQTQNNML